MLKLVYDLKAGFENKYIVLKDEEYDLSWILESASEDSGSPMLQIEKEDEADFYNKYKNNTNLIIDMLKDCYEFSNIYEASVLEISKLYFSHLLGGLPLKNIIPIWEPSNWRLVYEPKKRSAIFYLNALSASEVMKTLKLTKQQLYYYTKTGQLRKEYNPKNPKQFKYNKLDTYVLQKKLEKKYERYS